MKSYKNYEKLSKLWQSYKNMISYQNYEKLSKIWTAMKNRRTQFILTKYEKYILHISEYIYQEFWKICYSYTDLFLFSAHNKFSISNGLSRWKKAIPQRYAPGLSKTTSNITERLSRFYIDCVKLTKGRLGHQYLFTLMDPNTSWLKAYLMRNANAQNVARILESEIFPRYG